MASNGILRPRQRRVLALLAGAAVLAGGASVTTLAAWQDHEYVWGDGVGSSSFDVQQNMTEDDTRWSSDETSASSGRIAFDLNASLLTPGDTLYGWVQLRAAPGSRGGTVTLHGATFDGTPTLLANALNYGAKTGVTKGQCSGASGGAFGTTGAVGTVLVAATSVLTVGSGSTVFPLAAGPNDATAGAPVGVCFAVSLPSAVSRVVGGQVAAPRWVFDATSN